MTINRRTFGQLMAGVMAFVLVGAPLVARAAQAPDELIREVATDVQNIVRQDKAIQSGDMRKVLELIDAKVLPHFDFTRMTALAVGREWRNATPAQRSDLAAEFRTLLVRSYANAIVRFKDAQITVKPVKLKADDTEVIVRSDVKKPGAQPDSVDYTLYKKGEDWKVFDVAVAGVSLITNYRDSFGEEIKANGIDGLVKSLRGKNAQNSSTGETAAKK
ncbi:phospholipid-binding protein MlaC [Niveibacterium umoris]|uniref:Phospholipid transport system substrate-binding protein n=1 Tax=Niveibacterium umoris TaxID=1193620 RepID=A0A840BHN8_9RHOO|nr:ABC transporter substrate-binding protein [Niveibacterium umoris]MBB4012745.1 phospholipid transport system substrate-binding protein [Niveibacterium umoris]